MPRKILGHAAQADKIAGINLGSKFFLQLADNGLHRGFTLLDMTAKNIHGIGRFPPAGRAVLQKKLVVMRQDNAIRQMQGKRRHIRRFLIDDINAFYIFHDSPLYAQILNDSYYHENGTIAFKISIFRTNRLNFRQIPLNLQ